MYKLVIKTKSPMGISLRAVNWLKEHGIGDWERLVRERSDAIVFKLEKVEDFLYLSLIFSNKDATADTITIEVSEMLGEHVL